MIDNDAKVRHAVSDAEQRLNQVRPRVGAVHHQVGLRQQLESLNEHRVGHLLDEAVAPQIAVANSKEEFVLAISVQVFLEFRFFGLEITDHAHHHRLALLHFENPEVVFNPRTGLYLDRAHNSQRRRQLTIARGQRRFCVPWSGRIRRALRPSLIEQVDVAVNDRDGAG